jgi:hypothetical protein
MAKVLNFSKPPFGAVLKLEAISSSKKMLNGWEPALRWSLKNRKGKVK